MTSGAGPGAAAPAMAIEVRLQIVAPTIGVPTSATLSKIVPGDWTIQVPGATPTALIVNLVES